MAHKGGEGKLEGGVRDGGSAMITHTHTAHRNLFFFLTGSSLYICLLLEYYHTSTTGRACLVGLDLMCVCV